MVSGEPTQRTRTKRQAIIKAQEKSGLDVVEYCRTKGLCRSNFYGRRKQLLKTVSASPGFLKLLPPAGTELSITDTAEAVPINIRTPNGYQIELRSADENSLARIIGILKAL